MKCSKNIRGIFFSIDAILASIIILTSVLLSLSTYQSNKPVFNINHISDDLITSLAEFKLIDTNNSYINTLIDNGIITKPNNSILEQIGEFWGERNLELARNLSMQFVKYLPPNYGYGIYIDGEAIIENTSIPITSLSSAHKVISGIQRNRSSDGFIAKAFAIKTRKNNTLIVRGDVITSSVRRPTGGNNGNIVSVNYSFFIPPDATILGSYWFIEAAWTDTAFRAFLNGEHIPGSDANGELRLDDLNAFLRVGNNTAMVEYRFGGGGFEGGDDGATHLVINYSTEQFSTISETNKRYFAEVDSLTSIRYKKPIFVVGRINSININLSVIATTANLTYILDGVTYNISRKNVVGNNVQWSNNEILSVLNLNSQTYNNISNKYFWFQIDLDTYHQAELVGAQRRILPNSYVEIDYTSDINIFGHIDLTSIVSINNFNTPYNPPLQNFYRNLAWRFNISNTTVPLSIDSQFAWLYYTGTNPVQNISSNNKSLYSHPPNPLIVELARFGYTKEYMVNDTNRYVLNFTNGYGINPLNSLVSKTVLIPFTVGYGDTFQTLSAAVDDANNRLSAVLGEFVSATEINNGVITLSKIPSMWGPAIVEVRVWQ